MWQGSERIRRDLSSIAALGPLVLFNDLEEEADDRYYNAARLLARDGLAGPPYRKVHLVPFGEYVPLPKLFFFVAARLDGHRGIHAGARSRRSSGRGRSSSGSASATRSSTRARPPGGRRRRQPARDVSRTTPGTAAPERRSSTSRERRCARSRTTAISSVRRSPGSPASWTRAAGSSRSRGPTRRRSVTGDRAPGVLEARPGPAGASGSRALADARRTGRANLRPRRLAQRRAPTHASQAADHS